MPRLRSGLCPTCSSDPGVDDRSATRSALAICWSPEAVTSGSPDALTASAIPWSARASAGSSNRSSATASTPPASPTLMTQACPGHATLNPASAAKPPERLAVLLELAALLLHHGGRRLRHELLVRELA